VPVVKTSLFDYELPDDNIAQRPLPDRDAARLCVVGRESIAHGAFRDFPALVPEGALVVLNDTRVQKVRLLGTRRGTGGKVELLLLRRIASASGEDETWTSLGRANRSLHRGTVVDVGPVSVEVLGKGDDELLSVRVRAPGGVAAALDTHGHVPLPPYVRRPDDDTDRERYQTVFARYEGSVAAPTAGLHLTDALLLRLRERRVDIGFVTLHVGLGTFRPVSADDLDEHSMHAEERAVTPELASAVRRARERGAPVVAVGTTVVRALESARDPVNRGLVVPVAGETRLLIQPGFVFGVVDALLTNFHMPKSTLLALVSAFAGRDRVLAAYAAALSAGYRFLSYGDAMWIPEQLS
jgi:S-adenosylmethionine:tRNA ribosyltransferase-isomerase